MLEELKQKVLEANLSLPDYGLVIFTWGNVSARDEETGLVVIKASGIPYDKLTIEHMTVVDMEGNVVEGDYRPSSDTATHIRLYQECEGIRSIVHTHSRHATEWAQSGRCLPCMGATHSDYFYGDIPCTRKMTDEEIMGNYEVETGNVIAEAFQEKDMLKTEAVLVHSHGPFVWGKSIDEAVHNAVVLEYVAEMAKATCILNHNEAKLIQPILMSKHYNRKFGPDAYYGQQ